MLANVVDNASSVETPNVTRAGAFNKMSMEQIFFDLTILITDLWSIQNANQDTTTIMVQGTYMVTM